VTTFMTKVSECVEATISWMRSNRLQPNPEKMEVLLCGTARRQQQLPTSPHALLIDGCSVSPVKSVRDLGIHIGSDLTMQTHVKRTVGPIAMSRLVASAASNPSLGANSHTPDVGGCFGPLPTGLRK